jgi:hypothetical protein
MVWLYVYVFYICMICMTLNMYQRMYNRASNRCALAQLVFLLLFLQLLLLHHATEILPELFLR